MFSLALLIEQVKLLPSTFYYHDEHSALYLIKIVDAFLQKPFSLFPMVYVDFLWL